MIEMPFFPFCFILLSCRKLSRYVIIVEIETFKEKGTKSVAMVNKSS